jgi:putative FmdB family regulatory protein
MPLYEYQCDACGTRIEKIRKYSDPPLEICESCGGTLRKLPSSPAIQFKGSGWYVPDYAKKTAVEGVRGTENGNADKKGDSAKSEPKSDAKGDAKAGGSSSASTGSDAGSTKS